MDRSTKIKYVRIKDDSNVNVLCTDRKYVRMKHDTNENVYRNTKRRYPRKKGDSNVNAQMHKEKICKNERGFKCECTDAQRENMQE